VALLVTLPEMKLVCPLAPEEASARKHNAARVREFIASIVGPNA